jgi:hypothetical protein
VRKRGVISDFGKSSWGRLAELISYRSRSSQLAAVVQTSRSFRAADLGRVDGWRLGTRWLVKLASAVVSQLSGSCVGPLGPQHSARLPWNMSMITEITLF